MIKKFKDQRAASEAMAEELKTIALEAVAERGKFTIALTGGSSPLILHELLSKPPYLNSVPWQQSFIFWGDERMVPFNDEQNNAKMGFETLLNHVPVPPEQIYRMNSEISPDAAAEEYENILKKHFRNAAPAFDLILLGMGADGHTASLFPGTEVVHEQEKWVSKGYNAEQKSPRITLTAPVINRAKNIFFAAFGANKASTIERVLSGKYEPELLPAQLIQPKNGTLTWFLDEKSGKLVN